MHQRLDWRAIGALVLVIGCVAAMGRRVPSDLFP
jgi:hypothetical protein